MLKRIQTLLITLSLCVCTVWAGDLEDGNDALIRKDYVTALKKYKNAAAKNDAFAQLQVGGIYNEGRGVPQDYAEAVRWYKLAAEQSNAMAQFNLGNAYGDGKGVAQDYTRAHMWFNLAAVKGNSNAVKNRDIIAKQMTPQQVEQAQKLARECQARNFKNCD